SAIRCTLLSSIVTALTAPIGAQSAAPGFRLWGALGGTDTYLMDVNGAIVQTWPSAYLPGATVYLQPDGLLLRSTKVGSSFGPAGDGGGLQRVRLDGTVAWDYRYNTPSRVAHHDVELLPNGNVLMIAWGARSAPVMIANGRDPAITTIPVFWPDHVVEVRQTSPYDGEIVWRWDIFDHVVQDFDPNRANYGVIADNPQLLNINYPYNVPSFGDYNHVNSVDYDPAHDWIVLSAPQQDELWIIDHSTTTAEAAGHTGGARGKGGDILYRWGNPEAYGRGTPADRKLFKQHAPLVIPPGYPGAGNIIIFNNRPPGGSQVVEIQLPIDASGNIVEPPAGQPYGPSAPVWTFANQLLNSINISSAERLPNGNTLICSGAQGWIFEITSSGQLVWNHIASPADVFHAHYYEHWLWADDDRMSLQTGGTVGFDLIAGTPHAGKTYMLIGTLSGTDPGIDIGLPDPLPLNYDAYLLASVTNPNVYPLANSVGVLDGLGRGTATFSLPGGLPAIFAGLEFHHAYVVFDPVSGIDHISNAVPLELYF
ncbi:MAG: aryl-sulfate sulfotransferase, partial [Planctomycetes bacterium]|nr:aryl-sulfate sulfotransferase [Planctomycetota bacterium]